MATHLRQGSIGGDVGGKTLSTGQGELAAGFGTRGVTAREVGDVLLWDAVQSNTPMCPISLPAFAPPHPLVGGCCRTRFMGEGLLLPWD